MGKIATYAMRGGLPITEQEESLISHFIDDFILENSTMVPAVDIRRSSRTYKASNPGPMEEFTDVLEDELVHAAPAALAEIISMTGIKAFLFSSWKYRMTELVRRKSFRDMIIQAAERQLRAAEIGEITAITKSRIAEAEERAAEADERTADTAERIALTIEDETNEKAESDATIRKLTSQKARVALAKTFVEFEEAKERLAITLTKKKAMQSEYLRHRCCHHCRSRRFCRYIHHTHTCRRMRGDSAPV